MSWISLPFVNQNKKAPKLPEMLLESFLSIQWTKVHAFLKVT